MTSSQLAEPKNQVISFLENLNRNTLDPYCRCFSSRWVMKELNLSKYKTLKILHELREDNLVRYRYIPDEYGLGYWAWYWKGEVKKAYAL